MDEQDLVYRLMKDTQQALADCEETSELKRALMEIDSGFRVTTNRCVLEESWIDAIRRGLPEVERAIEEQRRFLRSHREIVRIDKAKQVTQESIRHLSQHSHYISNIQDGDIIPKQLLVLEREDTYAVYENRFLYTLLNLLSAFVEKRYQDIMRMCQNAAYEVRLDGDTGDAKQGSHFELHMIQRGQRLPRMARAHFQQVQETIYGFRKTIDALLNCQLMKRLKNTPPVPSPIVRTNVIKQNIHFRAALELFEFIESYQQTGYQLFKEEPLEQTPLPVPLKDDLSALLALQLRSAVYCTRPETLDELDAHYQEENQRREQQALEEAREREAQVQRRIDEAVKAESDRREREAAAYRAQIAGLEAQAQADAQAHQRALEAQRQQADQREQALLEAADQAQKAHEQEVERLNASLADSRQETETARQEGERRLAASEAAAKEATEALLQTHARERQQWKEDYEHRLAVDRKQGAEKLRQQQKEHQEVVKALKQEQSAKLVQQREAAEQNLQRTVAKLQRKLDAVTQQSKNA